MQDPFFGDETAAVRPGGEANPVDSLAEYLRGLRRRWKLVAVLTLVGLAAGVLHYAVTPPVYQAQATLQIERRSANSLLTSQFPWLDHYFNLEFYPTQYRLLQSRGLAEEVARDLRLAEEPRFRPAAAARGDGAPSAGEDRAVLGKIADRLRARLSVNPIRDTQLVEITYRSDDPEEAARLANAFAEAFIEFGVRSRSATMTEATDMLADEIAKMREEVREREARMVDLRGDQGLPITGEDDLSVQRLQKLNEDLMAAKREKIDRLARYQQLAALGSAATSDLGDPAVAQLRSDQLGFEREYQTKLQTLKPGHPDMQALAEQIERGREHLDQALAEAAGRVRRQAYAEYQSALREEAAIEAELGRLRNQMTGNASGAAEVANIQVELSVRRELLNDLVQRQSETAFATRLQTDKSSNVRVVDEALVPGAPTEPSLTTDLAAGLAGGLLLGVGFGLLLQFLDRTIKTPDEVERLLGLPVLTVIPDVSGDARGGYGYGYAYPSRRREPGARRPVERKAADEKVVIELLPHLRPRLAVSEAYRALRTALLLSSADELKLVAVTSVLSSEGKTATASNLAVVLAQLGRKVLLIDGDLRRPRLHKVFGVSNRTGMVSYLTTGSEEGAYHKTPVTGLYLMPSGPIPPNPSELLASDRMRELLVRLRGSFDFVVVDTPPALAVTDPTLIGSLADGVLLCIRSGRVDRQDAVRAVDRMRLADVRVLGAVLNAHRASGGGNYRYYYEAYGEEEPSAEAGSAA